MKSSFFKDMKIFWHVPEIRRQIVFMYLSKMAAILTFALFSPLILLGAICVGTVYVLDYIGQLALAPSHTVGKWLHQFQRNQINIAHSITTIEEIKTRIGEISDD